MLGCLHNFQQDILFFHWRKSFEHDNKALSACFSLQHHPENFSLVIIIASVSLKAYSLQEERQPHFLYVDVFGVNVEEAEILQVETEDRKTWNDYVLHSLKYAKNVAS